MTYLRWRVRIRPPSGSLRGDRARRYVGDSQAWVRAPLARCEETPGLLRFHRHPSTPLGKGGLPLSERLITYDTYVYGEIAHKMRFLAPTAGRPSLGGCPQSCSMRARWPPTSSQPFLFSRSPCRWLEYWPSH